jgi:uncharacterized protein
MLLTGALMAGLLGGLLAGLFGVGGGLVLVPVLSLALGLGQHEAQGGTLAVLLLPVGLPAVIAYRRRFPIRWPLVAAVVLGFLPAVAAGSRTAIGLPDRPLRLLFALCMLFAAWRTWRAGDAPAPQGGAGPRPSAWHGLWIGALGGLLSGLFGVGGAIAMIPFLVGVMGLSQHEAQATSLAAMLPPIGLPGVLVYARSSAGLPWGIVGAVAAGFLVGGFGGAVIAGRTGSRRLARAFALFVLASAAGMAWRALR